MKNRQLQELESRLRRERIIKLFAFLSMVFIPLFVLFTVDNLLASFVFAFFANYLLGPFVNLLERRGLNRNLAILIPFAATGALVAFGFYEILPRLAQQALSLEAKLPSYQVDLGNLVASTSHRFSAFANMYHVDINETVSSWLMAQTAHLSSALPSALSGSLTVLLLAPIFSYFMLADGRGVSKQLLTLVPNNLFEMALNLSHQLNEQMGAFIRARFLEAAIVGIVVWLGLQISGFPYASLLGLFAGITNLIPYLGPLIGAVPAILIVLISPDAAITDSTGLNLLILTSIYFAAQLVDIIFVIPLLVAKIVNLHPVTVIIVIIIGSKLMGILGMVISIPVASASKLTVQAFYDHILEFRG